MKPILSICIPTLNRPELILLALESIFLELDSPNSIEICISNNASELDYMEVEALIRKYEAKCKIKYIYQAKRIALDEHHHYVVKMATGEYIYYLGDDDFFLEGEFSKILRLISEVRPDLAIFNGRLIDAKNKFIKVSFEGPPREFSSLELAFPFYKDKASFGAILVRRELIKDEDFIYLYGTDHAYACFWLTLFREVSYKKCKIITPNFHCVALRTSNKNYNHIDVYFNKIPLWVKKHQSKLFNNELRYLFDEHLESIENLKKNYKFLFHLKCIGCNIKSIKHFDKNFYNKYKIRLFFVDSLLVSIIYKLLSRMKSIYCQINFKKSFKIIN